MIETKISFVLLYIARLKNGQYLVLIFTFWYGIDRMAILKPSMATASQILFLWGSGNQRVNSGGRRVGSVLECKPALSSWFLQEFRCVLSPLE